MLNNSEKIKIIAIYFFLMAGGLWHILHVFESIMSILAGPLLIGLACWLGYEYWLRLEKESDKAPQILKKKFLLWTISIVVFSFIAETVGVKTGKVFGAYKYGETLWPQIFDVPVAIGFAWLLMLISSIALLQRMPLLQDSNILVKITVIACLMTFFDFMMEPAAIKLGYWFWLEMKVPVQNYLAWFVLSFIFAALGYGLDLFKTKQPVLAMHVYFAQLVYFIMIFLK